MKVGYSHGGVTVPIHRNSQGVFVCQPPCDFTSSHPDRVTKHKCRNLVPTPSQPSTSKRSRDQNTDTSYNIRTSKKPRTTQEPSEYDSTPNASPSKKNQRRNGIKKSNRRIVSPTPTAIPQLTSSSRPMPESDHCEDLYAPAPPEELAANYAKSQALIPRQKLVTSPDLRRYSIYVEAYRLYLQCGRCTRKLFWKKFRGYVSHVFVSKTFRMIT